jgi:hypothetical protein
VDQHDRDVHDDRRDALRVLVHGVRSERRNRARQTHARHHLSFHIRGSALRHESCREVHPKSEDPEPYHLAADHMHHVGTPGRSATTGFPERPPLLKLTIQLACS